MNWNSFIFLILYSTASIHYKLLNGGPYRLIVPDQWKRGYINWLVRVDIEI